MPDNSDAGESSSSIHWQMRKRLRGKSRLPLTRDLPRSLKMREKIVLQRGTVRYRREAALGAVLVQLSVAFESACMFQYHTR